MSCHVCRPMTSRLEGRHTQRVPNKRTSPIKYFEKFTQASQVSNNHTSMISKYLEKNIRANKVILPKNSYWMLILK